MPARARTEWARWLIGVVALAAGIVAAVLLAGQGGHAARPRALASMFEDDRLLVQQPMTAAGTATVERTLATLRSLGVDRVRLLVGWYYLAPDNNSAVPPPHFDAANPAAYPAAAWAPYDRAIRLANQAGIAVDLDLSAPGPLWAMRPGAPDVKTSLHYAPSASDFEQFVTAVGRRYDGHYRVSQGRLVPASAALPRVSFWSVWNEPNQPGWIAPQWVSAAGLTVPLSARIYRGLVDGAFAGLAATGHRSDTILIGELAPEGSSATTALSPMPPLPFLRALYCLGPGYRPLQGLAAVALGCPARAGATSFRAAHPGLFDATGFAHHPYSFYLAPNVSLPNPEFVPLADLGRLETALDRAFAAYGDARRIPLYLTEYGYETSPPRTVPPKTSLRQQSLYLDEATYMASRDPRVRALSQFLLEDSAPDTAFPPGTERYWSTFQTGLEFLGGAPKPALNAYRLPIYVPAASGRSVRVWGMLRPATNGTRQMAEIQWRPVHGGYRMIATVTTTSPSGILEKTVQVPGAGAVRLAWRTPGGAILHSRAVGVTG